MSSENLEGQQFSLRSFLDREIPTSVLKIARGIFPHDAADLETPYAEPYWTDKMAYFPEDFIEAKKLFATVLKDGLFLDLGSGYHGRDMGYIADEYGARALVSVDKYNMGKENIDDPLELSKKMPRIRIKKDMLEFLASVRDGSCAGIAINGIDSCIIHEEEYHVCLAQEIARTLRPGGIAFGANANALGYLEKLGCPKVWSHPEYGTMRIHRKPNTASDLKESTAMVRGKISTIIDFLSRKLR